MERYSPDQFEIVRMNCTISPNAALPDDIRRLYKIACRFHLYLDKPDGHGNENGSPLEASCDLKDLPRF